MGIFNGIIRLRRDNDFNYDRIKNTFVPASGEVCLVDTALKGLRAKVGDGKTKWADLDYTDTQIYSAIESTVVRGYYKDGAFYSDSAFENKIQPSSFSVYINVLGNNIYSYNGSNFEEIGGKVPTATATLAGIMKLYGEAGQNTDGTMTQKAITNELNEKVEVRIDEANEMITFGNW